MAFGRVNTSFKTQQLHLIQSSLLQPTIQSNKNNLNLLEQDFCLDPNKLVLINIYQPPKNPFVLIWIHALFIFKRLAVTMLKEVRKKSRIHPFIQILTKK